MAEKRQVITSPDPPRDASGEMVRPFSRLRQRFLRFDGFRGEFVEIPEPKQQPAAKTEPVRSWQEGGDELDPRSYAAFRQGQVGPDNAAGLFTYEF